MAVAEGGVELTVDLEAQEIADPAGQVVPFEFEAFARHCLLHGLDEIARTLEHEHEIAAYEAAHPSAFATTALP
jgi:3-isopropylmalate/(R)-2-methylmalate dehydratase small subunit